jgi:hypothetical protein
MKALKLGRKGSVLDFFFIIMVVALMGGLMMLIGWKFLTLFQTAVVGVADANGTAALDKVVGMNGTVDAAFSILFFGICLVSVVLSYFIRTHPAIFFVALLMDFGVILLGNFVGQIYTNILGIDTFSTLSTTFPSHS